MKTLYSISLETGEVTALCPLESLCSGLVVNDGWIYYSVYEGDEWKSYRIRTDGTDNSTIGDFQLFSACIEADKIYYLDDNLQICSMDLDGAEKKILADGITAIRINVSDGWIYYSDTRFSFAESQAKWVSAIRIALISAISSLSSNRMSSPCVKSMSAPVSLYCRIRSRFSAQAVIFGSSTLILLCPFQEPLTSATLRDRQPSFAETWQKGQCRLPPRLVIATAKSY